ncbi:hypothetical protein F4604DRAFT_1685873 [Suillus subluteus]|nr:hypothetical protein F4604DRAFT_1685873 [Suillus subluteus]
MTPPEHVAEGLGHGRLQKRHRDASPSRPPTKRNVDLSRPPATYEAGPKHTPRVDESGSPTQPNTIRTHTGKQHKSDNHSSMPMEEVEVGQTEHVQAKTKVLQEIEVFALRAININQNHAPDDDEDMLLSDDSAAAPTDPPLMMSVPAIATISPVPSSLPLPQSSQMLKCLKTELTELRARHTTSELLISYMNVHLAEQETNIQNLEAMCNELTALQQDVKDMQAESCSCKEQLRTAEAKLAEQAHSTSILKEAYESLRQCIMPNVSIPPAFSNTMFLPIPSYNTPYSQGFSAGQAQAMEHLYTNLTPGPSTAGGTSLAHATSSSGQNGVAGSSTDQNTGSSQLRRVFSESASGTGPL